MQPQPNSHYFTNDAAGKPYLITFSVRGATFEVWSAAGLFSKDGLDNGTRVLLEQMQLPTEGRVLDLGCGIGVVGFVVKKFYSKLIVVQSDVTEKAVKLTHKNARKLGLETTVIQSDCYDGLTDQKFSAILVNPPRAAGKAIIGKMITGAVMHLQQGGSLQLVAMTQKGGKSYAAMMEEAFGNVEKIGRGSGFSLYRSIKE